MGKPPSFLAPVLQRQSSVHVLRNQRTGIVVARHIELAVDSARRRKGLLGRQSLPDDAVLAIAPCSAIHTFFMQFPIDVVFVDRQGAILKQVQHLKPWRLAWSSRAFAVLEFSSGWVRRSGAVPGDLLEVV